MVSTMQMTLRTAYFYQTDSWNAERDFAQYYAEEIACLDVTNDAGMGSFLVIDWQATWDCNLRYDFFTIEFDDLLNFFHNTRTFNGMTFFWRDAKPYSVHYPDSMYVSSF